MTAIEMILVNADARAKQIDTAQTPIPAAKDDATQPGASSDESAENTSGMYFWAVIGVVVLGFLLSTRWGRRFLAYLFIQLLMNLILLAIQLALGAIFEGSSDVDFGDFGGGFGGFGGGSSGGGGAGGGF